MDRSKQLKLGVILSYLSTGINIVVQLVYTPLMLRLLGQSEYGLYTLVASIVSYLSLFSLSFTASYTRFYTKYKEKRDREGEERLNGMFLTIFLVMAVLALVCGMVLAQFPKQVFGSRLTTKELDRAQVLMRILVVNIALTFLTGLLESIITAHECFVFQRIVVLVSAMMNPFICLPFLLMGHTSITIVVVTTIISVVKLVVDAGYCLRRLHIRFRFDGFDVGLLEKSYQALLQEKGLSDRVKLLGFRSDVSEILCACDCFVFPSYREGLPVALMEAMAAGLLCVASRIRGNVDLLADSRYLFDPKDEKTLCRLMQEAAAGVQTAEEKEKNRAMIQKYDVFNASRCMREIYETVLRMDDTK